MKLTLTLTAALLIFAGYVKYSPAQQPRLHPPHYLAPFPKLNAPKAQVCSACHG